MYNLLNFLVLQATTSQKREGSAPDGSTFFWIMSEIVITLVIFIGVYYIFKPVFGKKKEDQEAAKESSNSEERLSD
ncbi:MAG: hypothetical protein COA58_07100 [Bacteroidetes bacterium]|nr:MAG: hypothetical protein COA58_07100 [Bacteroidota bacterium]